MILLSAILYSLLMTRSIISDAPTPARKVTLTCVFVFSSLAFLLLKREKSTLYMCSFSFFKLHICLARIGKEPFRLYEMIDSSPLRIASFFFFKFIQCFFNRIITEQAIISNIPFFYLMVKEWNVGYNKIGRAHV